MKNVYENFNDLKDAAEKWGYEVSRISNSKAHVFDDYGIILYVRGNYGWRKEI